MTIRRVSDVEEYVLAQLRGGSFLAVVNHEGRYSVWPRNRELPAGWRQEGPAGTEEECLARIERIWTDLRPAAVRRRLSTAGAEDAG
ncbi:MbtH family NRPS accessory protein [Streptomyces sp. NPDC048278]|uniref:MbtH family protein n=1 Tax=Streptomyces sp. NPDC048278 TaxID=3155809 RepID=UPI003446B3A9